MMTEQQVPVRGGITYWTLVPCSREKVQTWLESHNLQAFMPPEQGDTACLKAALAEVKGKGRIVDSLKNPRKDGCEVVAVEKDHTQNYRTQDYRAKVVEGRVMIEGGYFAKQDQLQKEFDKQKALCTKTSISTTLSGIARGLRAVTLKPGTYWISEGNLERWRRILHDLANLERGMKPCIITVTANDKDSLQAVRDSVIREVATRAAQLREEIDEKRLTDEGLDKRKAEAEELHAKVAEYAELLGDWKDQLDKVIQTTEEAAVVAAMKGMVTV